MKYDCDIIQDLLPLYQDKICSGRSRAIVEEHISECTVCRKMAEQMGDNTVEEKLTWEKNNVIHKHQTLVNRKTTTIGMAMAGILMIPVLVCLICNLAIGHALDWFFIVLTAMLLVASLIVVPFIAVTKRLMWVIVTATASLILLLLTCCIYTHGTWFFVASSGSILGISVFFAPFVIVPLSRETKLERHRAALTVLWDTIWLYLLLTACGMYIHGDKRYWYLAMTISTYIVVLVWIYVLVIDYGKRNGQIKAGILVALSGIWLGVANDVLNFFLAPVGAADGHGLGGLDLGRGFSVDDITVLNANLLFVIIVVSVCVGGMMVCHGIVKEKMEHESEK
ncbi:MAG: zf-HC2 domain-containing protein [Lachnospiraceae bacterium]|nr:zf-HC2 domain-containing protein [Lachnospiraceae bacterium]